MGTTWQCTSHGCTEASQRTKPGLRKQTFSPGVTPGLPNPWLKAKPGTLSHFLPWPLLPLPMPLTFKLSYLKSFDFAQDVVLWHCLNRLLTFCPPSGIKILSWENARGSHRRVEGPGNANHVLHFIRMIRLLLAIPSPVPPDSGDSTHIPNLTQKVLPARCPSSVRGQPSSWADKSVLGNKRACLLHSMF